MNVAPSMGFEEYGDIDSNPSERYRVIALSIIGAMVSRRMRIPGRAI
jgi:hypothetical protein